jgi:hypothetical protein
MPERRPRIRSIKPEFFSDERINLIPVGARYTAIGLMSMADDRGRIKCMVPAVHAYVFPNGDVNETQFKKALRLVIDESQFAWEYVDGRWNYLWLPRFWRHQVINKPSESTLPPHPRDPYGGLSVKEAMAQFKRDTESNYDRIATGVVAESSGSPTGGLLSPRVGALLRSDPDQVRSLLQNGSELQEPQRVALLSALLAAWIVHNDPKAEPDPDSATWLTDMRRLVDDRRGDVDEVVRIVDWCQADGFWSSNILSPGKLRKQFTQLVLKARPGATVTPIRGRENASDLLKALNGGGAA